MKEKVNVLAKKLKPYSIPGAITLAVVLITLILKEIWPFGGNRIDYFEISVINTTARSRRCMHICGISCTERHRCGLTGIRDSERMYP